MNNMKQQGFTLVELIIVIVILGILAVTAAPRFLNLAGDARGATLDAVEASIVSINNLINAKARLQGVSLTGTGVTVVDNGLTITLDAGQPRTTLADEGTWDSLLESDDFTVVFNADIDETGRFTAEDDDKRNTILILPASGGYTVPDAAADTGCYVFVINYLDNKGTLSDTTDDEVQQAYGKITDGCS